MRVCGKAFGHDDGTEERPQEVERPEGVAVVHEEDERVTIRRVERHRTDPTAKLVLEKVSDAAQPRHLAGDAQHKALPGGPDRQSWVAHHPRRRAGRQRWSRHQGQSVDSSEHQERHEEPSSRHQRRRVPRRGENAGNPHHPAPTPRHRTSVVHSASTEDA